MARFVVREVVCKSVINRVQGMPFKWSINPYRGCRHACVYCYARPTHEYLGLNGADDFNEVIFAKVNAPQLVRRELARRSWTGDCVVVGTATDPYQQAETRCRISHGILEAFRDFRNPVSITTKSPLVLRDLDVLTDLARHAAVTVQMTVTTLDETLWRALEPTSPRPWKRLQAIRILRERGIEAGIFLSPILPGLTDGEAQLEAVIAAAAGAGAAFVWGGTLRLGAGFAGYYYRFLRSEYPELRERYAALYRRDVASAEYRERIEARVRALKARYGFVRERIAAKEPAAVAPVQLPLFAAAG